MNKSNVIADCCVIAVACLSLCVAIMAMVLYFFASSKLSINAVDCALSLIFSISLFIVSVITLHDSK